MLVHSGHKSVFFLPIWRFLGIILLYYLLGKKTRYDFMQISTKFSIAIHILTATAYFSQDYKVTSDFLAGSVGCNPVIIRNLVGQLKGAGLLETRRGPGGITLAKPLGEITFLLVYDAVEKTSHEELFRFHSHPNPQCPVGRHIHESLTSELDAIQQAFEAELARHTVADVYTETVEDIRKEG